MMFVLITFWITFCKISNTLTNIFSQTVTVLTTIVLVFTTLALPLTTNSMIQSWWHNTVAGGSATRSGGSRLASTITTNHVTQLRRDRTVRVSITMTPDWNAVAVGWSGCSLWARRATVFLRDLSVSRSRRRRNHVAGTRTRGSSKSCNRKNGKLHGRCRWICSSFVDYNRSARVTILCLLYVPHSFHFSTFFYIIL